MTSKEAASPEGRALINRILDICHDGEITIAEIESLHIFLRETTTTIYAFEYLRAITRDIVADGCVDKYESLRLKKAFERVVPKDIRSIVSTHLEKLGIPSPGDKAQAPAWRGHPATGRQIEYIIGLGGSPAEGMTKGEASDLIEDLLDRRPPTPRQMMLIRFFDHMELGVATKDEVSAWIDHLFSTNPRYELSWSRFKQETNHDPLCKDPEVVPIGGYKYYWTSSEGRSRRAVLWVLGILAIAAALVALGSLLA
jgi:hypothetical protein